MSFSAIRGQERAIRILKGFLSSGNIPSALLLLGPDGIGKTLAAREFAKTLICRQPRQAEACGSCAECRAVAQNLHPDVKLVNAAYQASLREEESAKQKTLRVETIRRLRQDMELQPLVGHWKVAIIDSAHTLEIEAANALLKILEEPPPQTLWILTACRKERLPKTVVSRCFSVPFVPLPPEIVRELLRGKNIDESKAASLARLAEGSIGQALELEQVPAREAEGPLAPFAAADALPRELYLARVQAERELFTLAQNLRLKHLAGQLPFSRVERPLRELQSLRSALKSNADPRLVLTLAHLEAEPLL